jgi:hypothetical protein
VQAAAKTIGQQLINLDAGSDADIESAFVTIVQRQAGALLVGATNTSGGGLEDYRLLAYQTAFAQAVR